MRYHEATRAYRVVAGSLLACALLGLAACSEPGAMTAGQEADVLVNHSVAMVAQEPGKTSVIREVRLGHALDVDQKVPGSMSTTRFLAGDPIKMSMWVVAAPAGSVIRVSVHDVTDRSVWSDEAPAPRNGSYLAFDLGKQMARGKYQVEVNVDHDLVSRANIEVINRESWARR